MTLARKTSAKTTLKAAALALLAAAILSPTIACNTKNKPTPENFISTLNAYFQEHPDCLLVDTRFPYETTDPAKTKQLNTLVKSQLLEVHVEPAIHASRFTVTPTGARYAPRFCFGHRVVTSIDSQTPLTVVNGFRQTQVVYHYKMEDVPIWAKSDDVLAAFPQLASALSGQASDHATLAQTIAGWQIPD
jgi:hypothetical protein